MLKDGSAVVRGCGLFPSVKKTVVENSFLVVTAHEIIIPAVHHHCQQQPTCLRGHRDLQSHVFGVNLCPLDIFIETIRCASTEQTGIVWNYRVLPKLFALVTKILVFLLIVCGTNAWQMVLLQSRGILLR